MTNERNRIMPRTLNIIGCGNVGKVLGKLWATNGIFDIRQVLNRSPESGERAVAFMEAGEAVAGFDAMRTADIYLIATPDDAIANTCAALAKTGLLTGETIVFHCSGALLAAELAPASACGASVASIHPIRSFAVPEMLVSSFAGTFCGMEGDKLALDVLGPAFAAVGAQPVEIDPEFKSVYHAAAVFASNYLVTVLDVALQAYEKAGIPGNVALRLMEPLTRGAVDNVFRLGTTDALTGPIARGDIATAVRQYRAVHAWDEGFGELYKELAKLTSDIAARRRSAGKPKP